MTAETIQKEDDEVSLSISIDVNEIKNNKQFLERLKATYSHTGITSDLTDKQVMLATQMDMAIMPMEISISAGEKRQITQYNPNDYFASIKLDISGMYNTVIIAVQTAPTGQKVSTYIESKKLLYELLKDRIEMHEDFLRNILHNLQEKDGLKPAPRK